MIGQYIQNYKIVAHLGEGGMGVVYKAVDNVLAREVALKMLHSTMIRQPQVLERFKKEAQVLARLLHPNIAVIYNFIEQDSQYYMVMEYVEGKNLDTLARTHAPLPHTMIAAMFIQALEGLQHAHKKSIFHRDIKPSNLILTPEGTVKLMDFGIAKIAGEQRLTQVNRVIGTVAFMAPELIEGKDPSVASDIYAAGITMYELLSGRLPFESQSDFNLMQDILKKKPAQLAAMSPSVPAALSKVVMKALEKKPENRFADAKAFQQALMAAVPGYLEADISTLAADAAPLRITATNAFTQISDANGGALAQATRMESPATIFQQIDRQVLRNKKLPYILAGVGLALLAVFIFFTYGNNKPAQDTVVIAKKDTAKKDPPPVYAGNPSGGSIALQTSVTPPVTEKKTVEMIDPLPQPEKDHPEKKEKGKKEIEKTVIQKKEAETVTKEKEAAPPPVAEKPVERITVNIDSKVAIPLRMRESISNNEDGRELPVSFTVTRPVVFRGVTIIKEGAIAKGRIKIGRVLSTVDITSVTAANGHEIALKERDHRKVKNLASERDYSAVLIKGTSLNF